MAKDSMKELFDLVGQDIESANEYSAVEKLKACGLKHNKACRCVETVILYKSGYFSLSSRLKRLFGAFDVKEVDDFFVLICQHLLSLGCYDSQKDIDEKIEDSEKILQKLEEDFNYRDDLYYYSSPLKRRIIILSNLHFSDFSSSLQNKIFALLGKERIMKNIDDRAKFILNRVKAL